MCMCIRMHVCIDALVYACSNVHAHNIMCACVRVCVCVYDYNIVFRENRMTTADIMLHYNPRQHLLIFPYMK